MSPDYVWCTRHGKNSGFWLHVNVCLSAQTNPDVRCPKRCKQRKPLKKEDEHETT